MQFKRHFTIIASTAMAYLLACQLNNFLFSSLNFSTGVSWIFLPSGLRLVFILLFVELGAMGIVLASLLMSLNQYFGGDTVTAVGAGLISGLSPWLARMVCIDQLKIDLNLNQLTSSTLCKVSMIFALLSPVMHQLWYSWRGHTENFLQSVAVMAIGDLIGTMVVLYSAKLLLTLLPSVGQYKH